MGIFDQISQQVNDALAAAPLLLQRLIVGLLVFAIGYGVTRLIQFVVVRAVRRTPAGATVELLPRSRTRATITICPSAEGRKTLRTSLPARSS